MNNKGSYKLQSGIFAMPSNDFELSSHQYVTAVPPSLTVNT